MKKIIFAALILNSVTSFAEVYKDTVFFSVGSSTGLFGSSKAKKIATSELLNKCKNLYSENYCLDNLIISETDNYEIYGRKTLSVIHLEGKLKNKIALKNVITSMEITTDLRDDCAGQLWGHVGMVNYSKRYSFAAAKAPTSVKKEKPRSTIDTRISNDGNFLENSEWKIDRKVPGNFFLKPNDSKSFCDQLKAQVREHTQNLYADSDKDLFPDFYPYDYVSGRGYSSEIYNEFADSFEEFLKPMQVGAEL